MGRDSSKCTNILAFLHIHTQRRHLLAQALLPLHQPLPTRLRFEPCFDALLQSCIKPSSCARDVTPPSPIDQKRKEANNTYTYIHTHLLTHCSVSVSASVTIMSPLEVVDLKAPNGVLLMYPCCKRTNRMHASRNVKTIANIPSHFPGGIRPWRRGIHPYLPVT